MDCLSLDKLYLPAHPLVAMTLCVLAIFACCLALDLVRQGLFAVTVDRNRGHRFELVWNKATERLCVRDDLCELDTAQLYHKWLIYTKNGCFSTSACFT